MDSSSQNPQHAPNSQPLEPTPAGILGWLKNSLAVKLGIICFLILILLIPLALVRGIVSERGARSMEVQAELTGTMGSAQTLTGPVLAVPFTYPVTEIQNGQNVTQYFTKTAYFLPEDLDVKAQVNPDTKHRGIFSAVVYNATLQVSGSFSPPDPRPFLPEGGEPQWHKARLIVGLTDLRSIQDQVPVKWGGDSVWLNSGSGIPGMMGSSLDAPVSIGDTQSLPFSFTLAFGGSSGLHFSPLGKVTRLTMDSPWHSPSAVGAFLPDKKNGDAFFPAEWKVLHLNRPFTQQFVDVPESIRGSDFGVTLMQPVNGYSQTDRCIKYGILIIALTYMVFFFTQAITRRAVHNVQYLVVGFGLVLFYLLLVSLSEHMTFLGSYLIAAASIVALITAYMGAIWRKASLAGLTLGSLSGLYVFIYVLVQQEDYALLMGSIGLLLVLAVLMVLTRRLDWIKGRKAA